MGQFRYVTNRTLKNKSGEVKGRIKVLVREGSDTAEVDYACPECGFSEHKEQEWQRPFIVKCSRCGASIKIPRLKDEIKKEKKAAKA
jgi:ribosomal protein L37AE/L43A